MNAGKLMSSGKNYFSLIACILVSILLLHQRTLRSDLRSDVPLNVTTWDALGYYMYLPSVFIYEDITELKWLPQIDEEYSVTGGNMYQARMHENGNYVCKYLGGVSIMEAPFFFIGHIIAKNTEYKVDGFSPPYQYALAFGAVLYCILALLLLRNLLLRFFSDQATAVTLLLLVAATNLVQYAAADSAQSHAFIFPLYVLIIYLTIKWHESPKAFWAFSGGLVIGLATICRPTEAIMLFIPLLWSTHTKEASKEKWAQVKLHRNHIAYAAVGGIIGILPQLLYWKFAAGTFIYDVGSKWVFLNPFFRVLFGWSNGWFIYTPITIFFVLGLFFIKKFPFRKAVIAFCLLNIWIIISWFDWKYGGTYSTRALVQSYPVFAFPFAAIIERIIATKWRFVFYVLGAYLIYVNLFQLEQYYNTVLHFRDMNRQYYSRIYLNNSVTALDMSLLDTDEILDDEDGYNQQTIVNIDSLVKIQSSLKSNAVIAKAVINRDSSSTAASNDWIKVTCKIKTHYGIGGSYLTCALQLEDSTKVKRVRLFGPVGQNGRSDSYEFYIRIPDDSKKVGVTIYVTSQGDYSGTVEKTQVIYLHPDDF